MKMKIEKNEKKMKIGFQTSCFSLARKDNKHLL